MSVRIGTEEQHLFRSVQPSLEICMPALAGKCTAMLVLIVCVDEVALKLTPAAHRFVGDFVVGGQLQLSGVVQAILDAKSDYDEDSNDEADKHAGSEEAGLVHHEMAAPMVRQILDFIKVSMVAGCGHRCIQPSPQHPGRLEDLLHM